MADAFLRSKNQLPEDLTELAVTLCDRIPSAQLKAIESEMLKGKTGMFNTTPAHGERVKAAQQEKAPGVFHIDAPATQLFKDFAKLSRTVTMRFYREVLGKYASRSKLISTQATLSGGEESRANPL